LINGCLYRYTLLTFCRVPSGPTFVVEVVTREALLDIKSCVMVSLGEALLGMVVVDPFE